MQYTCFSDGPTFSASDPFKYIIQHTGKLTPYLLLYPSIHTDYTQTGRSPSHVGIRIDLDLVVPQRNLQTKCQVHCANAK